MFPFAELKGLNSYFQVRQIRSDTLIFRMHTIFTAVLLMAASIMLTTTAVVGEPIKCFGDKVPEAWEKPINTFCWINTTYTLPKLFGKKVGVEVIYDGVGVDSAVNTDADRKFYSYYQWVCFVLFFQGVLCYAPKALWDYCEGGLLNKLADGLNDVCPSSEERTKKIEGLIDYLFKYKKMHRKYTLSYWACEALCLANVLCQMWLMNRFLGGEFWTYGTKVIKFSLKNQEERFDPMIYIFPRMTKCTFEKYGPSGTVEVYDNLCLLPLNIVNEKIYIFLWFWYILLAAVLSFTIISRILVAVLPTFRQRLLNARSRSRALVSAIVVSDRSDVGDWWLIYLLAKNMDPVIYRDFITELGVRMEAKERPYRLDLKSHFGQEKTLLK